MAHLSVTQVSLGYLTVSRWPRGLAILIQPGSGSGNQLVPIVRSQLKLCGPLACDDWRMQNLSTWLEATPFGETLTVFEVFVTFVGIGGGSYAGGRGAALTRLRTEYRSELYVDHLEILVGNHDPGSRDITLREVNPRIEALSFTERRGWAAANRASDRERERRLHELCDYIGMMLRPGSPLRRVERRRRQIRMLISQ